MKPAIDFPALWETVQAQYRGSLYGIHSVDHWRRVERNGVMLAERLALGEDAIVIARLFAVLHDSQRVNDNWDPSHGERAAAYAQRIRGTHFDLDESLMKKLTAACERHEKGQVTVDPLIGLCWDADRLDLVRCGVEPREELMSTAEGKRLARAGWR